MLADSACTLRVKKNHQNRSISHHFQDKCAFAFYTKIPDGRQKWRESHFWGKLPVASAYTLWVENFVEIAPSRTIFEINALLCFTQKFKIAAKSGRKAIFDKSC